MFFDRQLLSNEQLIAFYKGLLLPRLIEEKMLILLRQGKISKWFSGIGQEVIAVGSTLAMSNEEWILPMHRNLGVFTTRQMPLHKLFAQWQGLNEGYSKGRERSFHFGSRQHHICGMISHLGSQFGIADGIALAHKLSSAKQTVLVFTGEGATSEGDFHEALNVAAVWDLPVIFLIENNGYALSTPTNEQYRCEQLSDRARGYGMQGLTIDGNNVLEVYHTIKNARDYCIEEQKPILIECMTFRMRGHEEASGTKYIPEEVFKIWEQKDPVKNFENYLLDQKILAEDSIEELKEYIREEIEKELALTSQYKNIEPDTETELQDVYAETPLSIMSTSAHTEEKRFINAISDGLRLAMQQNNNLILMGQDIAEYGGAFKITEGFVQEFGKERIRNTPLCESAIIGSALGLSIMGYKSVVEMQFADFVTCGFNQIINNLAKIHYRWNQPADVVIRMPTGGGVGAGPFHSQSNEAWFAHTPGLKVVYPSTPADAKGLLLAAIEDPNPVLFFEHKALYRSISGPVPNDYYTIEIGKANIVQQGEECSIITYGAGVHWALAYSYAHPEPDIEIIDLRSLLPLDYDTIRSAVRKTGRALILHEDTLTGGIGGEIAAWIAENCFEFLDAPVMRCASLDTPVPFAIELEQNFLAKSRLGKMIQKLLAY
jgi:2-oxoisovalerate dehydrogenase E1 component